MTNTADPVDTDALRESAVDADHIAGWFRDRGNEEERAVLGHCRDGMTAAADEVDRLRAVIENAPHREKCRPHIARTCWKADAL